MLETPEAQLRRLDSLPEESGRSQRNGTDFDSTKILFQSRNASCLPPPSPHSAMQRRPTDSFGNRGKLETTEAQLRRLDSLPEESRRPQRNETDFDSTKILF
ncbi:hypothetical protein [Rossellomorea marisflavi]|uniref:hypothetical protein n=1 Tax=Rossellomorea marisflavi TaxID=189381 RepID=UPI0011E75A35|nr:hypothetical protein [Rossellomorea marisflavi]TYO74213.1 hypothetical protein DQ398_000352 [Rossellomorea marisflavi]